MESRTYCRSGSLFTLTVRNQRLAYLQAFKDVPPRPDGSGDGLVEFSFYDLWNLPLWGEIIGNGDAYGALRLQARYGNLKLRKLFKSPLGSTRVRTYDIENATWQADTSEFITHPFSLPRRVTISNITSTTLTA